MACQDEDENNGVLAMIEFAGASTTLPAALEINPWNTDEIADVIYESVTMSMDERNERHKINKEALNTFTSVKWAERNLDGLSDTGKSN